MSLLLKDKFPHERDAHIRFQEKGHKYFIHGKTGFTSVTTLVHKAFEPFLAAESHPLPGSARAVPGVWWCHFLLLRNWSALIHHAELRSGLCQAVRKSHNSQSNL